MMNLDPKNYQSVKDFFADVYAAKKGRNQHFSYRVWANQLGLKSPGYLANVINGTRKASLDLQIKLADHIGLDHTQKTYLTLLSATSQATTPLQRERFLTLVKTLNPDFETNTLDLEMKGTKGQDNQTPYS